MCEKRDVGDKGSENAGLSTSFAGRLYADRDFYAEALFHVTRDFGRVLSGAGRRRGRVLPFAGRQGLSMPVIGKGCWFGASPICSCSMGCYDFIRVG